MSSYDRNTQQLPSKADHPLEGASGGFMRAAVKLGLLISLVCVGRQPQRGREGEGERDQSYSEDILLGRNLFRRHLAAVGDSLILSIISAIIAVGNKTPRRY